MAPASEMNPPRSHAVNSALMLPEFAATSAGALKIPAPTTMPMINATTSPKFSAGCGIASDSLFPALGRGAAFIARTHY
jgi:hypothetical protein